MNKTSSKAKRNRLSRISIEKVPKEKWWKVSLQTIDTILKIFAVIIGGYWTWYTFKYQTEVVPSKELGQVSIKVDWEKLGEIANITYYLLRFDLANYSKHPLHLPVGFFNISGHTLYGYENAYDSNYIYKPLIQADTLVDSHFDKYGGFYSTEYFSSGKLFDDNSGIIPQGTQSYSHLIAIPTNRFDMITIEYKAFHCKYDYGEVNVKWVKDSTSRVEALAYLTDDSTYAINTIHNQIWEIVYSNNSSK